ncbi:cullin-1 [Anaeramoeba flamelloides]|uniref:Cullin-1 n=1 Tax=Anaeramoeba flamelloides TaxID=1746091 RepID=A0AAV8A3M5_9EUKA|nr:cullin-1 [Anaeramoeba flamelloides]
MTTKISIKDLVNEELEQIKKLLTPFYKDIRLINDNDKINEIFGLIKTTFTKIGKTKGLAKKIKIIVPELHEIFSNYFTEKTIEIYQDIKELTGIPLAEKIAKIWNNFLVILQLVKSLFIQFDDTYLGLLTVVTKKKLLTTSDLQIQAFYKQVYQPLRNEIILRVIEMINKERNGEIVNHDIIKSISLMLVVFDEREDSEESTFQIYSKDLEAPFLQNTMIYYRKQEMKYTKLDIFEYFSKVKDLIEDEIKRIDNCLHEKTKPILISKALDYLVTRRLAESTLTIDKWLIENSTENLKKLYQSLIKIPNGIVPFGNIFFMHIWKQGLLNIKENTSKFSNSYQEEAFELYISLLLKIYYHYQKIIKNEFNEDLILKNSLKKACKKYVNENGITKLYGKPFVTCEIIVQYCHLMLKNKDETELNNIFTKIGDISQFVNDKDIFQNMYYRLLSKRILFTNDLQEDNEKTMIGQLKRSFGKSETMRLENVINEVVLSNDFTQRFELAHIPKYQDRKYKLKILITSIKFLPTFMKGYKYFLSNELNTLLLNFESFYKKKFFGRSLNWVHTLGKFTLFSRFSDRNHKITASTNITQTLLLFNESETISFEKFIEQLNISQEIFKKILTILCDSKILVSTEKEHKEGNKYSCPNSSLKLNREINLPSEIKFQQIKSQNTRTQQQRILLLESTIIRIFKSKLQMSREELQEYILSKFSKRFETPPQMINKSIESLVYYGYLKIDQNNRSILHYLK